MSDDLYYGSDYGSGGDYGSSDSRYFSPEPVDSPPGRPELVEPSYGRTDPVDSLYARADPVDSPYGHDAPYGRDAPYGHDAPHGQPEPVDLPYSRAEPTDTPPPGRPPAGPSAPVPPLPGYGASPPGAVPPFNPPGDPDSFGETTGHFPVDYEPQAPVPRRVDLPDDVLAPRGTGGRRLNEEPETPRDPYQAYEQPYEQPPSQPSGPPTAGAMVGELRRNVSDGREPEPAEEESTSIGAIVGIWVGVVAGMTLAIASAVGLELPSVVSAVGSAVVVWTLTTVVVRRGFSLTWWVSGLLGVVPAAAVLARSFAPAWIETGLVVYTAAVAGTAAILLTKPVRRLSELVLEYVVAVALAFAGGGAVAGILNGASLGPAIPALAIGVGFGMTLTFATRCRSRLSSTQASGGDKVFYAVLVLAATVAAVSAAALVGVGSSGLAAVADRLEGMILDFRLVVIVPLAILGSAVVVRSFTAAGWWICSLAAFGTTALAVSFGTVTGSGRADIAPTLASSFVGYVLGFIVTVVVAFLIGMQMRSPAARRARGGTPARIVDEPDRLGRF